MKPADYRYLQIELPEAPSNDKRSAVPKAFRDVPIACRRTQRIAHNMTKLGLSFAGNSVQSLQFLCSKPGLCILRSSTPLIG